ncbi:MAG: flagellar motor switch protein FliM [Armatimonadota bacterium]
MIEAARTMQPDDGRGHPDAAPRVYDFRTGSELSREALSQLRINCERLAAVLNRIITAYLDAPSRFEVVGTEGESFEQFLAEMGQNSVVGLVQFTPALPPMLWQIDGQLIGPIVSRMLGGDAERIDRPATALEAALLRRFTQEMLDIWATTWDLLARRRPRATEMLTAPAQLQGKIREGETVRISLSAEIAGVAGTMNICLPVGAAQRLLGEREPAEEQREVDGHRLRSAGHRIVVPVSLILQETKIRVGELVQLAEGDIIPLGKPVDEPMTVAIRGRPKFKAHAGVVGGRLAARLVEPVPERA